MKKLPVFLSVFLVIFVFYACKKQKQTDTPKVEEETKVVSKTITPDGGEIVLDNVATVRFEQNTFNEDVSIDLIQTKEGDLRELAELSAPLYGVDYGSEYFVKVSSPKLPQSDNIEVELSLSDEFITNIKEGYGVKAFALLNQSMDGEEMINFEVVDSKYSYHTKKLSITLPTYYFDLSASGKYEIALRIATTPGENISIDGYQKTLGDACSGMFIRCPLNSCNVTSPFDPNRMHPVKHVIRPHRGVDFQAAIGTSVFAASDGVVKITGTERDKNGNMKGWGNYVILEHKNNLGQRFATLYAHLSAFKVSQGQTVNEGDLIALSGNTGIGTGPHLHLEYIVNANINDKDARIDPVPMINTTSVRLKGAIGTTTGVNNCDWWGSSDGSTWDVKFDYKDPSNTIDSDATLTFQDIEPVTNSPYTVPVGSLTTANGQVNSPIFCAHFGSLDYFKVKVFLTLANGTTSNCIYFTLKKPAGAAKSRSGQEGSSKPKK